MARSAGWRDCSEELAQRLRWHIHSSKREGADCSLLIVRPVPDGDRAQRPEGREQPLRALLARVQPLIRHTDVVEIDERRGLGVVLKGANQEGARAVFHRVRDALGSQIGNGEGAQQLVALGYAGSAAEWCDERSVDEAIRTAWKVRSLVTTRLPQTHETATMPTDQSDMNRDGELSASTVGRRRQVAGRVRERLAHGYERRGRLWLLPPEGPRSAEDEILRAKARTLGVPYVEIPSRLPTACRKAVPAEMAVELRAVAIGRTRGMLTVAMHDPCDAAAVTRLSVATGLTIFPVLAAPDSLDRALRQIAPV